MSVQHSLTSHQRFVLLCTQQFLDRYNSQLVQYSCYYVLLLYYCPALYTISILFLSLPRRPGRTNSLRRQQKDFEPELSQLRELCGPEAVP